MMKLSIDSNLSLSLHSKTAEKSVFLLMLGIEQLNSDGTFEQIAAYKNFENVKDKDQRKHILQEQILIKRKITNMRIQSNVLQSVSTSSENYKWFVFLDKNNRLLTFMTLCNADEKMLLKFVEKVRTAVVHFKSNQDKLQQKVESMASMFNDSLSFEISNAIDQKDAANLSKLSTTKDLSHTQEIVMATVFEGKTIANDEKGQMKETLTEKNFKMNKRIFFGIMLTLLILWIFINKFMKIRHKRH